VPRSEPSKDPQGAEGEQPSEAGPSTLVLRRRRADWSGEERTAAEDASHAAQRAAVQVAAAALAAHDGATGGHSDDVVDLCAALADEFELDEDRRGRLLAAAQLHDIGKVALPSSILDKPGPLEPEEWEVVLGHTVNGQRILASVPELVEVGRIVRHSHERFDGGGYPDGLSGDQIPLESRIVFCADAFHAIRCDRPYRSGRSAEDALAELRRHSGTQFDPAVVEALSRVRKELQESSISRLQAMTESVRSRRLVVLLLTLAMGGSALAAPGSPLQDLLFGGGDGSAQGSTCGDPCLPAALGSMGQLPGAGVAGGTLGGLGARGDGSRSAEEGRGASGDRRRGRDEERSAGDSPASGVERSTGGANPGREGSGPAGGRSPAAPAPTRDPEAEGVEGGGEGQAESEEPSESPGRSEEAPRRPAQPGTPTGGEPGRSEEAPGRPEGSGESGGDRDG